MNSISNVTVFAVAIFVALVLPLSAYAPSTYIIDPATCYIHYYNDTKTFNEASHFCEQNNGHLARINSSYINSNINRVVKRLFPTSSYYIDANRIKSKNFQWSNGTAIGWKFQGAVSQSKNSDGQCITISAESGRWSIADCNIPRPYVCEYEFFFLSEDTIPKSVAYFCTPKNILSSPSSQQYHYLFSVNPNSTLDQIRSDFKQKSAAFMSPFVTYHHIFSTIKCYFFNNEEKTFFEALTFCADHGGQLLHINNKAIDESVLEYVKRNYNSSIYYIGANKIINNTDFYWTDGFPLLYGKWAFISDSDVYQCVIVDPNNSGRWSTVDCNIPRPFVCEVKFNSMTAAVINNFNPICYSSDVYDFKVFAETINFPS